MKQITNRDLSRRKIAENMTGLLFWRKKKKLRLHLKESRGVLSERTGEVIPSRGAEARKGAGNGKSSGTSGEIIFTSSLWRVLLHTPYLRHPVTPGQDGGFAGAHPRFKHQSVGGTEKLTGSVRLHHKLHAACHQVATYPLHLHLHWLHSLLWITIKWGLLFFVCFFGGGGWGKGGDGEWIYLFPLGHA